MSKSLSWALLLLLIARPLSAQPAASQWSAFVGWHQATAGPYRQAWHLGLGYQAQRSLMEVAFGRYQHHDLLSLYIGAVQPWTDHIHFELALGAGLQLDHPDHWYDRLLPKSLLVKTGWAFDIGEQVQLKTLYEHSFGNVDSRCVKAVLSVRF